MSKRINVLLPEATIQALDRVASRGMRSRLVSEAVLYYIHARGKENLREQLKAGYQANAAENLRTAVEWFPLEEQAWQKATRAAKK
jgi:metal-responsive CopG/Arc/MetJ family transcriptional regulator